MYRKIYALALCALLVLSFPGAASRKYVALTFDDGPSGQYTERLLEGLSQRDARATFFLCGYRLREYPGLAEKISDGGHEIGCHGDSHSSMMPMGRRRIDEEITAMLDAIPEGTRVRLLRPPGGCCSDGVRQVAEAKGMPILNWSVDPRDWASDDRAEIEKAVLSQVSDGAVILMHDMSDSSVDAALDIVDKLQARGYQFVTVSELATLRGMTLRPGKTYRSLPPREDTGS